MKTKKQLPGNLYLSSSSSYYDCLRNLILINSLNSTLFLKNTEIVNNSTGFLENTKDERILLYKTDNKHFLSIDNLFKEIVSSKQYHSQYVFDVIDALRTIPGDLSLGQISELYQKFKKFFRDNGRYLCSQKGCELKERTLNFLLNNIFNLYSITKDTFIFISEEYEAPSGLQYPGKFFLWKIREELEKGHGRFFLDGSYIKISDQNDLTKFKLSDIKNLGVIRRSLRPGHSTTEQLEQEINDFLHELPSDSYPKIYLAENTSDKEQSRNKFKIIHSERLDANLGCLKCNRFFKYEEITGSYKYQIKNIEEDKYKESSSELPIPELKVGSLFESELSNSVKYIVSKIGKSKLSKELISKFDEVKETGLSEINLDKLIYELSYDDKLLIYFYLIHKENVKENLFLLDLTKTGFCINENYIKTLVILLEKLKENGTTFIVLDDSNTFKEYLGKINVSYKLIDPENSDSEINKINSPKKILNKDFKSNLENKIHTLESKTIDSSLISGNSSQTYYCYYHGSAIYLHLFSKKNISNSYKDARIFSTQMLAEVFEIFLPIIKLCLTNIKARIKGVSEHDILNDKTFRCKNCQGRGYLEDEKLRGYSVFYICEECKGNTFNEEVDIFLFQNMTLRHILDEKIKEIKDFFNAEEQIYQALDILEKSGLSEISLSKKIFECSREEKEKIILTLGAIISEKEPINFIFPKTHIPQPLQEHFKKNKSPMIQCRCMGITGS